MSDFKSRLINEKKELDEKISKLDTFILSGRCLNVDIANRKLMFKQLLIMQEYSNVLKKRLTLIYAGL